MRDKMFRRLSYFIFACLFLMGVSCGKKESPPSTEIKFELPPETIPMPLSQPAPETRPKTSSAKKKTEGPETKKAEEEGPFEHTGTVMKKGFQKAGHEMKEGFKTVGRKIKSGFE